jgi:hypothetical protein
MRSVVGLAKAMRRGSFLLAMCCALAAPPGDAAAQTWARSYGVSGNYSAYPEDAMETPEGFVVLGATNAFGAGISYSDFWLLGLGPSGEVRWERAYVYAGDVFVDNPYSLVADSRDGGFLLVGETMSFGTGLWDFWLVKVSGTGQVLWQRTYGGMESDRPRAAVQTSDSGFLVAGYSESFTGSGNLWVLKLDPSGTPEWQVVSQGAEAEGADDILEVPGTGYLVAGTTRSQGTGSNDAWLVLLDPDGQVRWQRAYGGPDAGFVDRFRAVEPTGDGGFLAAGDHDPPSSGRDAWLVRLSSQGEIVWQKAYDVASETVNYFIRTSDGNYVLAGASNPEDSGRDVWLMKVDPSGSVLWSRGFGGPVADYGFSVRETSDGGLVATGSTESFGEGRNAIWLLRLSGAGEIEGNCPYAMDFPVTVSDTSALVTVTTIPFAATNVVPVDSSAEAVDTSALIEQQCPACEELVCQEVLVAPEPACEGVEQSFTAVFTGGEGTVAVEWDLDGDTVADAAGNPSSATLSQGVWDVTATVTDSCAGPGSQSCQAEGTATVLTGAPPPEVSAVSQALPPLRVEPDGTGLTVSTPGTVAVNVYADAIGSWYAPFAGTGTVCGIASWTDNGDGTVTFPCTLPPDSWFVVTASTECAEGAAGPDSGGTERTTLGSWALCGPAP